MFHCPPPANLDRPPLPVIDGGRPDHDTDHDTGHDIELGLGPGHGR